MQNIIRRIRAKIYRFRARKWYAATKAGYDEAFAAEFQAFKAAQAANGRAEPVEWEDRYVCLQDRSELTGFDRHYTYHPAWAARILAYTRPEDHVDISSTLMFCAMVSAFLPVRFYDFRPAPLILSNLICGREDLTHLSFADDSIASLSCMHVIEHIGLGRYGDPLDPMGDLTALKELRRVVRPGGTLLLAVPVGKERVQFNAHRIYNHHRFLSYLPDFRLESFSLIPDGDAPSGMLANPDASIVNAQEYGCGCYWFIKK